jgi:hypothetical protein
MPFTEKLAIGVEDPTPTFPFERTAKSEEVAPPEAVEDAIANNAVEEPRVPWIENLANGVVVPIAMLSVDVAFRIKPFPSLNDSVDVVRYVELSTLPSALRNCTEVPPDFINEVPVNVPVEFVFPCI